VIEVDDSSEKEAQQRLSDKDKSNTSSLSASDVKSAARLAREFDGTGTSIFAFETSASLDVNGSVDRIPVSSETQSITAVSLELSNAESFDIQYADLLSTQQTPGA